jgi:hypothetical protein
LLYAISHFSAASANGGHRPLLSEAFAQSQARLQLGGRELRRLLAFGASADALPFALTFVDDVQPPSAFPLPDLHTHL